MKIKIFQIDREKDNKCAAFMPMKFLEKYGNGFDFSIYHEVYCGDVDCKNLEEIFEMFNINRPEDFKGWSLSVSDVVQVLDGGHVDTGYYFCDLIGWKLLTIQN